MVENDKFKVMLVGIIFDPATKKILLAKRKKNPEHHCEYKWCFPGGKLFPGEEVNTEFKKIIKEKTGYKIKMLGPVFSGLHPIKKDYIAMYFLSEAYAGKQKPGMDIIDLKWVKAKEVKKRIEEVYTKGVEEHIKYLR